MADFETELLGPEGEPLSMSQMVEQMKRLWAENQALKEQSAAPGTSQAKTFPVRQNVSEQDNITSLQKQPTPQQFHEGLSTTPVPQLKDRRIENTVSPELEAMNRKVAEMEQKLKEISGGTPYEAIDSVNLSLVPGLVIPKKFHLPEFSKYDGFSDPQEHLTMYVRKMQNYADNDKLLMHFFQESLTGGPAKWYMQLDRSKISSWKDMMIAFLKQYRHNTSNPPDRTDLQQLEKKKDESFQTYAQRWKDLAALVKPPLDDQEVISLFTGTLKGPYYEKIICATTTEFSKIVALGKRIEAGIKIGKIQESTLEPAKKPFEKKSEIYSVSSDKRERARRSKGTRSEPQDHYSSTNICPDQQSPNLNPQSRPLIYQQPHPQDEVHAVQPYANQPLIIRTQPHNTKPQLYYQ